MQTPLISLQEKSNELLENVEKNEKAMLEKISSLLNLPPTSPPSMLSSMNSLTPLYNRSKLALKGFQSQAHNHKMSAFVREADVQSSGLPQERKRRTSFSNESKMQLYNLDSIIQMIPQTTTNKALALKDYLPLLKSEKRNSVFSVDNNSSNPFDKEDKPRKSSVSQFHSKGVKSRASRFKEISTIDLNKKIECEKYLEIYRFFQLLFSLVKL